MKLFFLGYLVSVVGCLGLAAQTGSLHAADSSSERKLLELLQLSDDISYADPDSSLWYALQARDLARRVNSRMHLAAAYQRLGVAYRMKGYYDSAYNLHHLALEIWEDSGDTSNIAGVFNNLGIIYDERGINEKAISYYLQALRLYEQLSELGGMAMIYNNLGIVNKKEGNYGKVLEYYEKALLIYEQLDHRVGVAIMNGNIGSVHLQLRNFDDAIAYSQTAIDKYRADNINQYIPHSMENIGLAYFELGNMTMAEKYSKEALRLYQKYGNQKEASFSLGTLAEIYLQLNQFSQAEEYAQQSLSGAAGIGVMDEQIRSLDILYRLEKLRGNFDEALGFFERYSVLKDSVMTTEKMRTLEELQIKYETEKKEQELKVLKAESELQRIQIEKGRYLIMSIAGIAIFMILALMLLNSRKRYKLKAQLAEEKELLQKNRFKAVIDAEENERKRIARELHDGLGQLLSTARLTISALDEDEQDTKVQNSIKLIDTAVYEVRSISHNMMPNALSSYGLEAALEDLVRKINESGKIKVDMKKDTSLELGESESVAVYRVVQEAFNNAIKYADAGNITFSMSEAGNDIMLSIKDDGKGFDTSTLNTGSGIGWDNMQSRMELIGGRVSVFSRINGGTRVEITVPIPQNESSIPVNYG